METLARRYHVRRSRRRSPACRLELAALFAGVENRPQDPDNLFRIAIALEQRAAEFFTELPVDADAGSAEQRPVPRAGGRGARTRRCASPPSTSAGAPASRARSQAIAMEQRPGDRQGRRQ